MKQSRKWPRNSTTSAHVVSMRTFLLMATATINDRGDVSGPPRRLPASLCWRRLTFDEVLEAQKARDRRWRDETLGRVRAGSRAFMRA